MAHAMRNIKILLELSGLDSSVGVSESEGGRTSAGHIPRRWVPSTIPGNFTRV